MCISANILGAFSAVYKVVVLHGGPEPPHDGGVVVVPAAHPLPLKLHPVKGSLKVKQSESFVLYCMGIPLFTGYPITVNTRYISTMYLYLHHFFAFIIIYNCKHQLVLLIVTTYLLHTLLHG